MRVGALEAQAYDGVRLRLVLRGRAEAEDRFGRSEEEAVALAAREKPDLFRALALVNLEAQGQFAVGSTHSRRRRGFTPWRRSRWIGAPILPMDDPESSEREGDGNQSCRTACERYCHSAHTTGFLSKTECNNAHPGGPEDPSVRPAVNLGRVGGIDREAVDVSRAPTG